MVTFLASNALTEPIRPPRNGTASILQRPSWLSPGQAIGPPDAKLGFDDSKAWASLTTDADWEWLEVTFPNAATIDSIRVVESLNAGAVIRAVAMTDDGEVEVWSEQP